MAPTDDIENEVRPFVECTSASSEGATRISSADLDWFGNTALHHCFANGEIILSSVLEVLGKFPEYAQVKNQFGRIPLHYALDRLLVNTDAVKKLIQIYPEGVRERDNDNKTPYDVAVKWKHSNTVKKLLLDVDPSLDRAAYFKMQYGILAVMYNWFFLSESEPRRNRIYSSFANDHDDRSIRLVSVETTPDLNPSSQSRIDYNRPHLAESSLTDLCDLSIEQTSEAGAASNSKSTQSSRNSGKYLMKDVEEDEMKL